MADKILLVDDEPMLLAGTERHLRRLFPVVTAVGGERGLFALQHDGPFAVVVSDLRMPGMDGVRFLSQVKERSPDTTRIMLTGQADLEAAILAVNENNLFRFLTKPCEITVLASAVKAGIQQHQLMTAEKELLEKTLTGAVKVMTELLSTTSPRAFGRALRVKRLVHEVGERISIAGRWQVELAAMLSQIACVTIPAELVDRDLAGQEISDEERATLEDLPRVAARLLSHIPRLDAIRGMIERLAPEGTRSGADPIAVGARILHYAFLIDRLLGQGMGSDEARATLQARGCETVLTEALLAAGRDGDQVVLRSCKIQDLESGMVFDEDVRSPEGLLLVAKGQEATDAILARLFLLSRRHAVVEPVRMRVHP